MLDVRRMRVLREVAARGSFSAAAEALDYTQSAVSQQIAALEREAGTRLVDRSARGVSLTDAGRALVVHAEAIIQRLDDAEAELDAIAGLRGGRLRLTTFATAGATIMPRAIVEFRRRHPEVELTLTPEEPESGETVLRAGDADIALTISSAFDPPRREADLDRVHLLDDPFYLLLPKDHPLADKPRLRLGDVSDDPWILGSSRSCPDAVVLVESCREAGFDPQIAFHSDDYLAIQGFVAAGFGVSFIPDLALIAVRDDVVVRSLGARPPLRTVSAATLTGSWASPAKRAMLEVLQEVAGEFAAKRAELALAS